MKLLFPISPSCAKPFFRDVARMLLCVVLGWGAGGVPSAGASEHGGGGGPTPYVKIEPAIVANLAAGGKFMKVDVQAHVEDLAMSPEVKLHTPALRHELLLLFAEQNGAEIRTPEGLEKLKKQALEALNGTLKGLLHTKKNIIGELYFTSFMVQ